MAGRGAAGLERKDFVLGLESWRKYLLTGVLPQNLTAAGSAAAADRRDER